MPVWPVVTTQEHVFWTLVGYSTLVLLSFTRFFYCFLTAFSAYKTYATISPYKYPLKPSSFPHILSFFSSLFHLHSFRFF